MKTWSLSIWSKVKWLTYINTSTDQFSPRRLNITCNQVHSLICAWPHACDSMANLDRAFGSGRCELHDAITRFTAISEAQSFFICLSAVIDIQSEPHRFLIKLF